MISTVSTTHSVDETLPSLCPVDYPPALRLLGDRAELWTFQREWVQRIESPAAGTEPVSGVAPPLLAGALNQTYSRGVPQFIELGDTVAAWMVPHLTADHPTVFLRRVPLTVENLSNLLKTAGTFAMESSCQSDDLRNQVALRETQLDAYAMRVSADLEELSWLRTLTGSCQLSEKGNSTIDVAGRVLPSLRELIHSEFMALMMVSDTAPDAVERCQLLQTGLYELPEELLQKLVTAHGRRGSVTPVVRNHLPLLYGSSTFEGVESAVIVSIATSEAHIGWLVAVNKHADGMRLRPVRPDDYPAGVSEVEFGTLEASLMTAAASVFASHTHNCELFQEKEVLLRGVIRSLINAIDAKDSYTCGHSDRVAETARMISEEMGLPFEECEKIYMTGLLHDVGKIGVPDQVLNKPGRLTDEEFDLIKLHPVIGYEILKHLDNLSYVLPGVLHHHESIDGTGYPGRLVGEHIPLAARILAVADAFDAMTSDRPYRKGMPSETAQSILEDGRGVQWDASAVDAFLRVLKSAYPISRTASADATAAHNPSS